MSVVNGQLANQTTFNQAFISRTALTTSTVAKLALLDPDFANSGATITNAQKAMNKAFEGVGATGENDTTINDYANQNYITNGDSRKVAVEKLDAKAKQMQDDMDAAYLDLVDHGVRIGVLETDVGTLQGEMTTAQSDINTLQSDMSTAQSDINTLQSDMSTAQSDISNHEGRLDDLETATMNIGGDKTFTGANIVVQGNFEVQGTLTAVNSTNLEVEDQNILTNKNGSDGSAEGAGLDVERPAGNAGMRFDSTLASKWKIGLVSALYEVVVSGVAQVISGLKDFSSGIKTDTISESVLNAGVTIDGTLIKDGLMDGRDVSVDGAALDSHIGNTSNPHSVTAAQVGADATGTAAAAVSAHEGLSDPHPQYLTPAEGAAAYDAIGAASTVQGNLTTHTSDTANPHSVTKTQVGLGNVTDDAQLKRAAGDIDTFTEKVVPVANDWLLIEDSADSLNKKKVKISSLPVSGGTGGQKTFDMKLNGQYGGVAAFNAVDGHWIAPTNCQITNIFMVNEVVGSSGTTELDLKIKPYLAGSFTSVFLTTPKISSTAAASSWIGVGDTVTGCTAPVLTSLPFTVAAKSALRLDLIAAQAGAAAGTGLVIAYEEI